MIKIALIGTFYKTILFIELNSFNSTSIEISINNSNLEEILSLIFIIFRNLKGESNIILRKKNTT